MALAFYLARVLCHGIRTFIIDARRYPELRFEERHVFWKKVQTAAFIALAPAFLVLGLAWRLTRRG
jgi:hypothetical protein